MFVTRVRTRRRSFTRARSIAKLKPPLCSAENKLPIGVKMPFSTKCSEWVIYAELVTCAVISPLQKKPTHEKFNPTLLHIVPSAGFPYYFSTYLGTTLQCTLFKKNKDMNYWTHFSF